MTEETAPIEFADARVSNVTTREDNVQRIAVLRLGTLGDAMLTTPLYAGLKRLYPSAQLTVIASQWNAIIAENHPAVDKVVAIPPGLRGVKQWIATFAKNRVDLYIDPKDHRSTTSRAVAEAIRAKRKLVVPGNLPLLSSAEIVPPAADHHFVDSALAPLTVLAPDEAFERQPSIHIPEHALKTAAVKADMATTPYVVVNVSAGSPTRRWTEEKWKAALEAMLPGEEILVISAPTDQAMAERIASARSNARYIPTGSLMEAAALVAKARGLVTSDTSIVHIASAFNIPTLALYFNAPLMLRKFSPLAEPHRIILAPDEQPVAVIEVAEVLKGIESLM